MTNNIQRNPFFLPSGFEPQEIINILEAKGDNEKKRDKIKERKQIERRQIKWGKLVTKQTKICNKRKPSKKSTKKGQIQCGYDLATKWGWDGINRPYTPKIMSVFGGNKRKKG